MLNKNKYLSYPLVTCISLSLAACNGDSDSNSNDSVELIRSDQHPNIVCENLQIPLRDGTLTSAFVYRPDNSEAEKYPTVLTRTPYSRIGMGAGCFAEGDLTIADGTAYARGGYAYVVQSVRGTYTSEGEFDIFRQEKNDGYDSVEWLADQSWSNGDVGIRGASYVGMTSWQATVSAPPSLKAASISISSEDYHREWTYDQGIPHLSMNISWPELTFTNDQIFRQETANGTAQELIDQRVSERQLLSATNQWSDWVWQLPLTSMNQFDGLVNSYNTWLEHPTYDEYWQNLDVGAQIEQVQIPVLIHGSWYDIFADGTFASFASMQERAGSDVAKQQTRLLVSQYGHATDHGTPTFGAEAMGGLADGANAVVQGNAFRPYDMDYFDRYLKGSENDYESSPIATLAVMVPPDAGQEGRHFIVNSDQYPLANTEYQAFYLDSDGDANNRAGSGSLSMTADTEDAGIAQTSAVDQASSAADLFSYDPLNPVPTTGGNLCCGTDLTGGPKSGAVEQADVEVRDDVLVYTSEPLTEDLVVIGPVSMQLFAKSSAMDTDFMAKLVDVRPDGSSHNILDGAVRASLRNGSKTQSELIEANRTYEYSINLGHTGTVFPAGHRIRLQVSSSNFPKFARNLNTGESNETTSETQVANQVILHDASHPSRLILPIVSGVNVPDA